MAIAPGETGFQRHLPLEGSFNFRDLGGYRTTDGSETLVRRLYRADGPHALTEADTARLEALDVATVIDLRTESEAAERGHYTPHLPAAVTYSLSMTDVLPDSDELPSWIEPEFVAARYREMLDAGNEAVSESLAILTDPDAYPALIHCSAGKDRTGILSAIILGVLGVGDETIVEDYALSGPAMVQLVEHFRRRYPDAREQLTRISPALVAAEPETMRALPVHGPRGLRVVRRLRRRPRARHGRALSARQPARPLSCIHAASVVRATSVRRGQRGHLLSPQRVSCPPGTEIGQCALLVSSASSSCTRRSISSRIGRTTSIGLPAGSSSSQSR